MSAFSKFCQSQQEPLTSIKSCFILAQSALLFKCFSKVGFEKKKKKETVAQQSICPLSLCSKFNSRLSTRRAQRLERPARLRALTEFKLIVWQSSDLSPHSLRTAAVQYVHGKPQRSGVIRSAVAPSRGHQWKRMQCAVSL